jgi:hypothetical protein
LVSGQKCRIGLLSPRTQVSVKGSGIQKGGPHVLYLANVPIGYICVKAPGSPKSPIKHAKILCVPLFQSPSFKRISTKKHAIHGGHSRGIKVSQILIERPRICEHERHVGGPRGVPSRQRLVEGLVVLKGALKADDIVDTPVGNGSV